MVQTVVWFFHIVWPFKVRIFLSTDEILENFQHSSVKFLPSEMIVYNYILDTQENTCQLKLTPGE